MKPKSTRAQAFDSLKPFERESIEDVLRALLECEYRQQSANLNVLSALTGTSPETTRRTLEIASAAALVVFNDDEWALSSSGREIAVRVMRAHRLTETRLAQHSGSPPSEWHGIAHRAEHAMSDSEINRLADLLGNPRFDPHGDPIPTREGFLPAPEGHPLLSWPIREPGVISHIEDEPPKLFQILARSGIFAGMRFTKESPGDQICELRIENRATALPAELVALIRARPLRPEETMPPPEAFRLSDLGLRQSAEVLTLLPGCIGPERSRLLDLGFVPGSLISYELISPLREPIAYRVRGTMIALRRSQADQVLVKPSLAAGTVK